MSHEHMSVDSSDVLRAQIAQIGINTDPLGAAALGFPADEVGPMFVMRLEHRLDDGESAHLFAAFSTEVAATIVAQINGIFMDMNPTERAHFLQVHQEVFQATQQNDPE